MKLDDNSFPKQIWSLIFRGKPFANFGPEGYALAHLADHKDYNNRMYDEFTIVDDKNKTPLYGLFCSPTNTVFLPTSLIRPSDFSPIIRKILIERANDLYGDFCDILPPNIKLDENLNSKWHFLNFKWSDPVGSLDSIDLFLNYRKEKINSFLNV